MTPREELAILSAKLKKIKPNTAINVARRRSIMQRIEELQLILGVEG